MPRPDFWMASITAKLDCSVLRDAIASCLQVSNSHPFGPYEARRCTAYVRDILERPQEKVRTIVYFGTELGVHIGLM
jgi:hypothetical protein